MQLGAVCSIQTRQVFDSYNSFLATIVASLISPFILELYLHYYYTLRSNNGHGNAEIHFTTISDIACFNIKWYMLLIL